MILLLRIYHTSDKMYCKNCGAEVPKEADFCPNCGTKVEILEKPEPPESEEIKEKEVSLAPHSSGTDSSASLKKKKSKKKVVIISTVIAIIVVGGGIFLKADYNKTQKIEYLQATSDLNVALLESGQELTECGNKIADDWSNRNSIRQQYKYSGSIKTPSELSNLYSATLENRSLPGGIKEEELFDWMTLEQKVKVGLSEYKELYDVVINFDGSYFDFAEKFNKKSNALLNQGKNISETEKRLIVSFLGNYDGAISDVDARIDSFEKQAAIDSYYGESNYYDDYGDDQQGNEENSPVYFYENKGNGQKLTGIVEDSDSLLQYYGKSLKSLMSHDSEIVAVHEDEAYEAGYYYAYKGDDLIIEADLSPDSVFFVYCLSSKYSLLGLRVGDSEEQMLRVLGNCKYTRYDTGVNFGAFKEYEFSYVTDEIDEMFIGIDDSGKIELIALGGDWI